MEFDSVVTFTIYIPVLQFIECSLSRLFFVTITLPEMSLTIIDAIGE